MQTLTLTLRPQSAFGTPLLGDTLFGQLCWLLHDSRSEAELTRFLDGYTDGKPFAVVSDALPHGFVPRPNVPLYFYRQDQNADRKAVKKQTWLPLDVLDKSFEEWLEESKSDKQVLAGRFTDQSDKKQAYNEGFVQQKIQPHNSINRLTGTTGSGFAPYSLEQIWYAEGTELDVHIVFDETRIKSDEIFKAFEHMGQMGFGRDATVGLGKFEAKNSLAKALPANASPNAVLTLAPSAPQGLDFDAGNSFYQLFTRFGRHGGQAVQSGKPFKTPVLLAKTGAVFSSSSITPETRIIGQGIGGNGLLSKHIAATVQQGYAPVIPIHFKPQVQENP